MRLRADQLIKRLAEVVAMMIAAFFGFLVWLEPTEMAVAA